MKKNLTKKLMLSVLTLAFAVVSLGASTFAWFTISEKADVQEIDFQVVGQSGIEIAVSKVNGTEKSQYYIEKLPSSAIWTATGLKETSLDDGFRFKPVSIADGVTAPTAFTGNLYNHATYSGDPLAATAGSAATDGYIAFKLYVKADAQGFIRFNAPFLTSTATTSWVSGVDYTIGTDTVDKAAPATYSVLSALRLGVIPASNVQLNLADDATKLATKVFENGEITKTVGDHTVVWNTLGFQTQGALSIYNDKYEGQASDIPAATGTDLAVETEANNYFIFQVSPNVEYSFDIYIWVEGYDGECVNAIFAQAFKAAFAFEYKSENNF